jgi:DNA cross-link repair 1A protein
MLPPDQPAVVGGVSVMPIDANHCPGAVMFLFEVPRGGAAPCHGAAVGSIHGGKARPPGPGRGGQGRSLVLHTGDMRWHGGMALHPALTGRQLDVLMLDTTYATPRWSFPPQDDAVALLVAALRREAEAGPPGELAA